MEAAAHGNSTLGIPKSVGQEFVQADAAVSKRSKAYQAGKVMTKPPRMPKMPKLLHPGDVDALPVAHTSKHH